MEDPVVLLERSLYGHPLVGPVGERQFEKVQSELGSGKVPNWECVFVNRAKRTYTYPEYVDDYKTGWEDIKTQNPMSNDPDESTAKWASHHLFLTMFIWVALRENAETSKGIVFFLSKKHV